MGQVKIIGATALVSLIVGALLYRQFAPVASVTKEVTKDRIVTVTHTVKAPDGTETSDSTVTQNRTDVSSAKTVPTQVNWAAGLAYNTKRQVSADLARRILGPVFIVVGVDQAGAASIGLRAEF